MTAPTDLSVLKPLTEADIAPANTARYTLDGNDEAEARIHADQKIICDALAKAMSADVFCALVLMGGYGRGEGGFTLVDGKPAPYNDYDYFIVVRGLDRTRMRAEHDRMQILGKELEEIVGVEVDFALLSREGLPGAEYSLMNSEMIWGHRVVCGDEKILDRMPRMTITGTPLAEFSRLMTNRGSLLLLNKREVARNGVPSEPLAREQFVKYLFKAVLASVDALLAATKHFHPSYPVKQQLLAEIAQMAPSDTDWPVELARRLVPQYELALDARFHPDYSKHLDKDLSAWQADIIPIWLDSMRLLEEARLGQGIGDWGDYARTGVSKGQSGSGLKSLMRNVAITLRDYGVGTLISNPARAMRYPRERLLASLPLLLTTDDIHPTVMQALACSDVSNFSQLADCYLTQWTRYA